MYNLQLSTVNKYQSCVLRRTTGTTCAGYVSKGWCRDGAMVLDMPGMDAEWTPSNTNHPELNCRACGKPPVHAGDHWDFYINDRIGGPIGLPLKK